MSDLISRQAAIDALEKVAELFPWRVPGNRDTYDRYNEAWNDAIGRAEIEIEELPSAQPEQRWIPCSERLPQNEKKTYWVCTDTGYQCECRWTNVNHFWTDLITDWHWHIMDIPRYTEVVAWMPLPEPWRGEQDDY